MNIRVMVPEDYQKIHTLWTSVPGMGLRSLDDSLEGIARFLRRNPASCFVAEEGGRVAGTILCGHDGRRGYIYHTAVHPGFRRRGVGRGLVDAATDALRAEGIMKVALVVFAANAGGNEFWESIGFTRREDLIYRNKSLNDSNR